MLRSNGWIVTAIVSLLSTLNLHAEPTWSISGEITDQRGMTFESTPGIRAGVMLTPNSIGNSVGNQSFSAVNYSLYYSASFDTTQSQSYTITPFYTTLRLDVTDNESGQTQSGYFTGIFSGTIQEPQSTGDGWGDTSFVWVGGNQRTYSFGDRTYVISAEAPTFPTAMNLYANDYSTDWLVTASMEANVIVYQTPEPSTFILASGAALCMLIRRRKMARLAYV